MTQSLCIHCQPSKVSVDSSEFKFNQYKKWTHIQNQWKFIEQNWLPSIQKKNSIQLEITLILTTDSETCTPLLIYFPKSGVQYKVTTNTWRCNVVFFPSTHTNKLSFFRKCFTKGKDLLLRTIGRQPRAQHSECAIQNAQFRLLRTLLNTYDN